MHKNSLMAGLSSIWCDPSRIKVKELKDDFFPYNNRKIEWHKNPKGKSMGLLECMAFCKAVESRLPESSFVVSITV